MRHIDLGFVVLHYNNIEDTKETISSIGCNIDTADYHIVIVDNASPNGSGKELLDSYKDSQVVSVIINDKNVGFSAGNNVGIKWLRKMFDSDFIILSNNDIYLYEKSLYAKIKEAYNATSFAAMGPMILTGGGNCDANPISDEPYSRELCLNEISRYRKYVKLYNIGLLKIYFFLDFLLRKYIPRYGKNKAHIVKSKEPGLYLKSRSNVVLHGCFLIFSRIYFDHFPEGLDSRTFMYSEENILYHHIAQKHLLMLYNPDIIIHHKEGASVNKAAGGDLASKVFRFKLKIESHKAYLGLLDELGIN